MSILKSICLQNFLGYVEPQSMDFAIPNDQPGSGLTLIVGEINSGKSSIFEATKKLSQDAKFLPKERNPKDSRPLIKFFDKDRVA
ncbi:MAG: AAA family ATPase [Caedimonas sp.]|nr:AAA family ATPase [Caedimonas sp.]